MEIDLFSCLSSLNVLFVSYVLNVILDIGKEVKSSKADKLFEGVVRPNCILDIKTDKKSLELEVKWGTKS